jgi:hypothetical protein
MAHIKEDVPRRAKQNPNSKIRRALPYIILGIIISLMALHYLGYIDLSKFKPGFMNSGPGSKVIPQGECPKTSCEITENCCSVSNYDPSLGTNRTVFAVLTYAKCDCPIDTEPTPIGEDTQTTGGPYKICKCKGVEG